MSRPCIICGDPLPEDYTGGSCGDVDACAARAEHNEKLRHAMRYHRRCGQCGCRLGENWQHDYCMSCLVGGSAPQQHDGKGRKDDAGKLPIHLIAPELIEEVSKVLAFGASKYAPRNWEYGMDWSRPFSAAQRHLWEFWQHKDTDPETGLSHLAHAACCVMFLLAYHKRGIGTDDRPKKGEK